MTLDEKIAEANRLRISYGQYVAQYHPPEKAPEQPRKESEQLCCVVCGKPLKGNQRKYCSKECTRKQYSSPLKPCPICGKPFERTMGPKRYCSQDCRRVAKTSLQRVYRTYQKAGRNHICSGTE